MYYSDEEINIRISQLPEFQTVISGKLPVDNYIVGIRSGDDAPNRFDDVFYLRSGGITKLETTGTTNPGTPVLNGGFRNWNKEGAAVVESNRIYRNLWQPGYHQGEVKALKQTGNAITIYRDGNRNNKSEQIGRRSTGYYGINFHPDEFDIKEDNRSDDAGINGWSAGCQVNNRMDDYNIIIDTVWNQKFVTFILLDEFSV